jgi:hypothetical protein
LSGAAASSTSFVAGHPYRVLAGCAFRWLPVLLYVMLYSTACLPWLALDPIGRHLAL